MLTKEPKGRDVNDGDTFAFNAGFTAQVRPCLHTLQPAAVAIMQVHFGVIAGRCHAE